MKRLLIAVLLSLSLTFISSATYALGTYTATSDNIMVNDRMAALVITITATADAAAGTYPDYTIIPSAYTKAHRTFGITGWYLRTVEVNPGAVTPTALWDMQIWNTDKSYDLAQNLLINMSATNTYKAYLAAVGEPIIDSNWVISISNNAVHSAVIVLRLTFCPE